MKKSTEKFLRRISSIASEHAQLVDIHAKINLVKDDEILSVAQLKATYTHILNTHELAEKIDQLELNQSIRFVKNSEEPNPLPRTCVIQKFPDGHLELIVMPNRKLASGEKNPAKPQNGSQKKMKVAYRIDDPLIKNIYRARLEIELGTDSSSQTSKTLLGHGQSPMTLERITNEATLSQQLSKSKYVSPIYLGSPYYHKRDGRRTRAIYAFSELGLCDLIDMRQALNEQELAAYNVPDQMPYFFKPLISSLLRGLCDMEAAQIIHIDIDFRNIMLFRDEMATLVARYIDFDNSIDLKKGPSKRFGGTHLVNAPDTFDSHLQHASEMNPSRGRENAIFIWKQRESYGWNVYYESIQRGVKYPPRTRSDFKDCCWSVGVIIFQLLTQRLPRVDEYTKTTIAKNVLLKGLLAPTREERFSAAEALACWEQNPVLAFESRPAEQYTMREFLSTELAKMDKLMEENSKGYARQQALEEAMKSEMLGLQKTLADMVELLNMPPPPQFVPAFQLDAIRKSQVPAASSSQTLVKTEHSKPNEKTKSKEFSGLKKGFLM